MKRVLVIGGGPAGLIAAITAAKKGAKVTILEKMPKPGRKLLMTGKGRCNLTNVGEIHTLIDHIPGNGEFLYSSFYKFSNEDLVDFFGSIGIKTKVERGGRIFPVTDSAVDIVESLVNSARKNKVEIVCGKKVNEILIDENQEEDQKLPEDMPLMEKLLRNEGAEKKVKGVRLEDGHFFPGDAVILATGGKSYSVTGSTGDGYKMAAEVGHKIIFPRPSLVPLETKEEVSEVDGLNLRNISIKVYFNKKLLYENFGEICFTPYGVNGPLILSASRHLVDVFFKNDKTLDVGDQVKLYVDYKPALDEQTLYDRICRDFLKYTNKQFKNSLDELLPQKLIPFIVRLSAIDPEKPVHQVTKEERRALVRMLKKFPLTIKKFRPIDEAIVTAGGIETTEINPSTMESKLIKGLFFAGEVIDVDGYTGGYNLQIAFSTGHLAGTCC